MKVHIIIGNYEILREDLPTTECSVFRHLGTIVASWTYIRIGVIDDDDRQMIAGMLGCWDHTSGS